MTILSRRQIKQTEDAGVALILVLVFLVAIGFLFIVLGGSASTDLANTGNLASQRSVEYAASSASEMAVQTVRYSGQDYHLAGADCLPNGSSVSINSLTMFVDCTSQAYTPSSGVTRVVNFFTCAASTSLPVGPTDCDSTNALVEAQVSFDDYNSDNKSFCTPGGVVSSCGSAMTINSWVVETGNR